MTYYLLQSHDNNDYLLLGRDSISETFFNEGTWSPTPPIKEQLNIYIIETTEVNKNKKIINWWLPNHFEYVDATLVYRCRSLEWYKKWCNKHPELFIQGVL